MRVIPLEAIEKRTVLRDFVHYCMSIIPRSFSDDEVSIVVRQLFQSELYPRFLKGRMKSDLRRN